MMFRNLLRSPGKKTLGSGETRSRRYTSFNHVYRELVKGAQKEVTQFHLYPNVALFLSKTTTVFVLTLYARGVQKGSLLFQGIFGHFRAISKQTQQKNFK
jgi:hypothetical protein